MTSNEPAGNRLLGTLRAVDGKGVVRMEDRYDTDIDDLSSAITDPSRLACAVRAGDRGLADLRRRSDHPGDGGAGHAA